MKYIQYLLMLIVSSVVLNVWFFRFNKATLYRGGGASNMVEEFAVYGLNETMVYLVGGLKILAALGLLLGFITQKTIRPSAGGDGTAYGGCNWDAFQSERSGNCLFARCADAAFESFDFVFGQKDGSVKIDLGLDFFLS